MAQDLIRQCIKAMKSHLEEKIDVTPLESETRQGVRHEYVMEYCNVGVVGPYGKADIGVIGDNGRAVVNRLIGGLKKRIRPRRDGGVRTPRA